MRAGSVLLLCCLGCSLVCAQTKPAQDEIFTADHETAIARGLAYLARQQQADGSFQNRDPNSPDNAPRFTGPKVALTSLSLMAFLSAGRVPEEGKHGQVVRNAVEFLVKSAPEDGYFGKVDGSRMYGHAITTLALAEAYGAEGDARQRKRLRGVLEKAVRVLLAAQNTKKDAQFAGGWRYEVASGDSDLSVTGWCALALRAAHNAGVDVPRLSAERASGFVLKCWRPEKGAFAYQPGSDVSITMTGVGVLCLNVLDRPDRPEVQQGAKWLLDHPVTPETDYPYYARYYSAQAGFQVGGETWVKIWNRMQSSILHLQQKEKDGSWPTSKTANEPGKVYSTAMSVMTLSLPMRLLPAYQR